MAFSNTITTDFKTYLTRVGTRNLLNNKFLPKYFSLKDYSINYSVSAVTDSVLVKVVTGGDIKSFYNGGEDLKMVADETTSTTTQIAKRELSFINECDNTEYGNIVATINLGNYLQTARETLSNLDNVSSSYKPYLRLYDIVKTYEYTQNAFGQYSLWDTKNINIDYSFDTDNDYRNYLLFDNTHIIKEGNSSRIEYNTNRFPSPFKATASTYRAENGIVTLNGPFTLSLYPSSGLFYKVDGTYLNPEELTESIYNNSISITPSVKFNNIYYDLKNDASVRTYKSSVNNILFRFDGLLEASIVAAKNLFNFYGKASALDSNVKVIPINMNLNINTSDGVKPKSTMLKLNLTLDTTETTWNSTGSTISIN
jgi:hypothetical protein